MAVAKRLLLGSSIVADVADVVRFLLPRSCWSCSPLKAETVEGFEKVTCEVPELVRSKGDEVVAGEFETVCGVRAVVGLVVEMTGKVGFPCRRVLIGATVGLRRRLLFSEAGSACGRTRDSEGRVGKGGGTAKGTDRVRD